ncbi:MAG: sulfite exporter TauE/SafE family protein [bacterium]
MDYSQLLVISAAVIGSAIIKNSVGIGAGIFLLPLLSLVLPPKLALALGAPAMLVSDLVGVRSYWKEWDRDELIFLLPPAVGGVVLGGVLIALVPGDVFKIAVGVTAVVFSTYNLFRTGMAGGVSSNRPDFKAVHRIYRRLLTILFGFAGGTASTLIHAGGMVMSVYLISQQRSNRRFVGTLVLFFATINFLKVLTYYRIGILNRDILILVGCLSPLIILGGVLGNHLNKRIAARLFRTITLVLVFLIGLRLLTTI